MCCICELYYMQFKWGPENITDAASINRSSGNVW